MRTVPGDDELQALYDELGEGGEEFERANYDGHRVRAPDRTEIGMRDESLSGGRAIDAVLPNGTRLTIHIK